MMQNKLDQIPDEFKDLAKTLAKKVLLLFQVKI